MLRALASRVALGRRGLKTTLSQEWTRAEQRRTRAFRLSVTLTVDNPPLQQLNALLHRHSELMNKFFFCPDKKRGRR